ncbi:PAS domain-containing protein [Rhizobium sp. YIM 134829]|uniref:PAS domain-containing sensor histidine kinase n=1 Tax=Rhizobium sp. YIM 134829 TaxID=3390453 RepID=UPI00397A284E
MPSFSASDSPAAAPLPARTVDLLETTRWEETPLGPRAAWPATLTATIRVIQSSPVPMVLLCGPEGVLIYNEGYASVAAGRHPACYGQPAVLAWPEVADFNRAIIAAVSTGETRTFKRQPLVLYRNGAAEEVWLDLDYSPVIDESGTGIAVLAVVVEVTEAVKAEAALERNREKLALALQASGIVGIWDWDVIADRVFSDDKFAALYGVDPQAAAAGAPISAFIRSVYPEDGAALAEAMDHAMRTGDRFSQEYRLMQTDGSVRWVLAEGRPLLVEGRCERFPGIAIDITAQKKVAEAHARAEAGFRTLADAMPQMVWSTRPDGFHDYYNARWYEFTGMPAGSTDGEAWNGMFHPDDQERAWAAWRASLATGDPYQIEYRLRHHSGAYRWVLGRALPIRDAAGAIMRWYGTCTDIHDAKMLQAEREVVAHELSHRIKNIFSVLSGIISLSARAQPAARAFADELRRRIDAMGRAHDFIRPHSDASRQSIGESTFFGLTQRLLEPYTGEHGSDAIRLEGDDAPIADAAATPLALILHELGTNAAKYGALSGAGGRVRLIGRIESDVYHLIWKEEVPEAAVTAPAREGFGSRLIAISAEGQLGGSITKTWEPDGLRADIRLPLASLTRSGRLGRPGT